MSNASLPFPDAWSTYLAEAQAYFPTTFSRVAILLLVNSPLIAIILNVLWQLLIPRNSADPPIVFHWIPILGSAIAYGNDPINFFFSCREKYGDVFTFVLLGRRVTVALGVKGNNFILGGKSTVMSAEDAYKHLTTPVFGKDVVYDIPNDKFMEQKRFVKVGLTPDNFRAYVGMIEDEVDEFLNHDPAFTVFQSNDTSKWGSFNAAQALGEITILTASRTLQGREVRLGLNKTFSQLYNDLDGGFTALNFLFPSLPLPSYYKRDAAHQKMSAFYIDIIKNRRAGNSQHDSDMIEALMKQSYRDGTPLKDHEIAHIMIALLMAGQHTSSASGAWALLHLAHKPDIAEALYQEQLQNFSTPDGKLRSMTYEELRALPILDAVIRETLRLHPPIHSMMRKVRDPVVVPPSLSAPTQDTTYIIPKGHYVFASPAVSQTDPGIWRDTANWDPYRWSDPEGVAAQAAAEDADEHGEKVDFGFGAVSKGTDSPYQPFGAGKHRCIGEQFAYLQLGTIISTLVRRMELRIDQMPDSNFHTLIPSPKISTMRYRRRKI